MNKNFKWDVKQFNTQTMYTNTDLFEHSSKPVHFFMAYIFPVDQQEKRSKLLNKDSGGLLTNAANHIWRAFENLQSGEITVRQFHLLQKHQENFFKIINIMTERDKKETSFNECNVLLLMKIREKEIQCFERTLHDVGIFVESCQHFSGNFCL